jgi:pyruvoyl-dependent arginine decarboxylase (PvlArgDC)
MGRESKQQNITGAIQEHTDYWEKEWSAEYSRKQVAEERVCSRIQVEWEGKVNRRILQGLYRNIQITGKKSGQQNTG